MDYLRRFTNAIDVTAQLAHVHALLHATLNQLETLEANMATQDDINQLAAKIDTASADLANEITNLKSAHPDVDLTPLEQAVSKLTDLDTSNTPAPNATDNAAAATTDTAAATSQTPTPADNGLPAADANGAQITSA